MTLKRFLMAGLMSMGICAMTFCSDERCSIWIDLYRGEPIAWETMIKDLASCDILFLGEAHRVQRHHELQKEIIVALSQQNKKILLGIEQMEVQFNEELQRYNQNEISFEELATSTQWSDRWRNYRDYQPILEAALGSSGKVIALNAKSELIRSIGRNGFQSLSESERMSLPETIDFEEPLYEQLMNQLLMVHQTFSEDMLKNVYHAQVSRDEMMAYQMGQAWMALEDSRQWIGVVLCGSGHCHYGLGTASRLQRRLPDSKQRIILMSESGDTVLTGAERSMMRDIELSHEDLRFLNRPIADYLHVTDIKHNIRE